MLSDSAIKRPADLHGKRIGAIAGSTNMTLAESFEGVETVAFDGGSDDVFFDMIGALRAGEVDGFIDDDVALVPLESEADLTVAFTVPTRNLWGVGVAKDRPELLADLNGALTAVTDDGRLAEVWRRLMPALAFPFDRGES